MSDYRRFTAVVLLTLAAAAAQAADDPAKPLRASPDGHFLMKPDGEPFFYLGEHVEMLLGRLNREDTELYLQDRARKGFTVIVPHLLPRFPYPIDAPNAYGEAAFIGGDLQRPNEKYFAHVDWVIERAHRYGLRMGLAPLNQTDYVNTHVFTEANVEAYGRWLGKRYKGKGVIWLLGWDSTPIWLDVKAARSEPKTIKLTDFRPVFDLMAKAITEGSGGEAFITFHPPCCSFPGTAEPRTSIYLGGRDWLDMNMLQSSHFKDPEEFVRLGGFAFGWDSTFNYQPIRREYDSLPTRPVIDGEPQYEDIPRNLDSKIAAGRWDEVDIRNSAYHAVFAGAAGHNYNHLSVVWLFDPQNEFLSKNNFWNATQHWKEVLDDPGARQIGHVKSLMLSRPYFTRIPDQSAIVGEAGEGSAHIGATRDRTGSYMLIYLPLGQPVTVDMLKLSGSSAVGWWYDPRTGSATRLKESFPTNRPLRFTPPSSGRGNDWVLVLDDESKGFTTPGNADRSSNSSQERQK